MKVALKTSAGKYVSAEQGGGLDYGDVVYTQCNYDGVAPLYANRTDIGPWETFELEKNDDNSVSFKTANGNYITAEDGGGAGLSTNRTDKGPWECFYMSDSGIKCRNDASYFYWTNEQGADTHLNATRVDMFAWEMFSVVELELPAPDTDFTEDELRAWKGNLCGLPLNLPYAPNGLLFTPGYVAYDDTTRDRIRKSYRDEGWTHFALNLTNHSTIYRNYYPNWDDSFINKYLTELLSVGLITVGYSMGDADKVIDCKADESLVKIALGKWEDSKPIKRPALDADNTFYLVKQRFPNSRIYWHNPPYQGAPFVEYADWGLPQGDKGINAKVWRYMVQESFVKGLLFQGKAWENNCQDSINVLRSFIDRLGYGINGWPHPTDIVDYEETAYYLFNMNGFYHDALDMTKRIRDTYGTELKGFGNG